MTSEEVRGLVEMVANLTTDWDGKAMSGGEEPRIVPSCEELRRLASTLTRQEEEIERWHNAYKIAHEQAMANGAAIVRAIEEEREATVAYLRVPRGAMQHVADGLADAINRGEHRKPCA